MQLWLNDEVCYLYYILSVGSFGMYMWNYEIAIHTLKTKIALILRFKPITLTMKNVSYNHLTKCVLSKELLGILLHTNHVCHQF